MKEIPDYLSQSAMQYFATVGEDGKPKVRPFQFMFEHDGKLWFCTSNKKKIYREVCNNPNIELCTSVDEMSWMRLSAKVIFSDDLMIKKKVFEQSSLVAEIYKYPENQEFEVFYLENVVAHVSKIGEAATRLKWENSKGI